MSMKNMRLLIIILICVIIACTFGAIWLNYINTQSSDIENLDNDDGFIFAVTDKVEVPNVGTVIKGTVLKGVLSVNDVVQIVGIKDKAIKSTIKKLELKKKNYTTAKEGEEVGLVLDGVNNVEKGQVVTSSSRIKSSKVFSGKMHVLTKQEKGVGDELSNNSEIRAYINFIYANGNVEILDEVSSISAGNDAEVKITLNTPMAVYNGEEIFIYNKKNQKIAKLNISQVN